MRHLLIGRFLIGICCFFLLAGSAVAAAVFPELTGRVVDAAHILSPSAAQALSAKLADFEAGTSNQLIVVTLPSLGGEPIEQYGVELGRHWQIGQKGANNGALLIVAMQEHQVRIEVGYGLEGELTDAQSSMIINQIMMPDFHEGRPDRAVIDGAKSIMLVLGKANPTGNLSAQPYPKAQSHQQAQQSSQASNELKAIKIFAVLISIILCIVLATRYPNAAEFFLRLAFYIAFSGNNNDSGGGGVSGGGGSFGGGGASGRW